MAIYNIHEAKTQFSQLVGRVLKGETVVIAKAGKPVVKLMAIEALPPRRLGFLQGQFTVPEDFDTMFVEEIVGMFGG